MSLGDAMPIAALGCQNAVLVGTWLGRDDSVRLGRR
jgi:hypothetical protein